MAVVVAGCVVLWAINYVDRIPLHRLAALLGVSITMSDMHEGSPTPSVTPHLASRDTSGDNGTSAALSIVAVQTFDGPALVRQGAGVAVSTDGLILTTTTVAPYGSGSYIYQIATSGGQLLRARRVASDVKNGLVLLLADINNFDAVFFDTNASVASGVQLEAISAQIVLSHFAVTRLPAWVVWSGEPMYTALSLDRAYGYRMDGALLVDGNDYPVGVLHWSAQPSLIGAVQIHEFLDRYLSESVKN